MLADRFLIVLFVGFKSPLELEPTETISESLCDLLIVQDRTAISVSIV